MVQHYKKREKGRRKKKDVRKGKEKNKTKVDGVAREITYPLVLWECTHRFTFDVINMGR